MKPLTAKDIEAAGRIPETWTALGAIGFPSATAQRLHRLGLVERRMARPGMARFWDYRRIIGSCVAEEKRRALATMAKAEQAGDIEAFAHAAEQYGEACAKA